uniref:Protein kinase domain-containing protein n=1 Tax=Ananas comosus var. bracteatus TaxID=296719 RepID=A0A6V7PMJ1_ANACO|nr:unnamed protein product [Ananas comosus var. bracteatus]
MSSSLRAFFYFLLLLLVLLLLLPSRLLGLNSDGVLLLSFKYSVLSDPLSALADWDYADDTPCSWNGVVCMGFRCPTATAVAAAAAAAAAAGSAGGRRAGARADRAPAPPRPLRQRLNGSLPAAFFNASSELRVLSLADNEISGQLPEAVARLQQLQILNLSDNALVGVLPANLTLLRNLTVASLAGNYFSGGIPGVALDALQVLDLSSNLVNGTIRRISAVGVLEPPAFAGNPDLCGRPLKQMCTIPSTLSNPPPNVTDSKSPPAFAAIPKNTNGNSGDRGRVAAAAGARGGEEEEEEEAYAPRPSLHCGGVWIEPEKRKRRYRRFVAGALQSVVLLTKQERRRRRQRDRRDIGQLGFVRNREGGRRRDTTQRREAVDRSKSQAQQQQQQQGATLVTVDGESQLELETLLKASAYILGATGSSIVYKAVLADGTALAVRRIGESSCIDKFKDFDAQVRAIAKFRHPNLLRLRGFYWGADEKLLIHDYAPNGSLANISFSRKLGSSAFHLNWEARLRIARGVARGLAYLHEKKCVHGNVKPSNILLSAELEPLIGDFGLERLVSGDGGPGSASYKPGASARLFGSKRRSATVPGPESLKNLKPNAKWDVYAFGMVLLELIAGRVFSEVELCQWNAGFVVEERNRILRMADPAIRGEVEGKEDAVLSCFKLGFACCCSAPQKRPGMKDAVQVLERIPSAPSSS